MMITARLLVALAVITNAIGFTPHTYVRQMMQGVRGSKSMRNYHFLQSSVISENAEKNVAGSAGVEFAIEYLNSVDAKAFVKKLVLTDKKMADESEKLNFWSGQSFTVTDCVCTGIVPEGLTFTANCDVKGKPSKRDVLVPFLTPVTGLLVEYMQYSIKRLCPIF